MAVDMFLKIGDIKGESLDKVYKDWIDVLAWSWGLSQSGTAHMGPGAGGGKVSIQDMSFTKFVDRSSANLMLKCCNGKHYPEATLVVRKSGETPLEYYKVKMTDVMISSISTGGSGGEDRVTENVSLNFAKVQVLYTPQKPDGTKDAGVEMVWSIAENVGSGG